MGVNADLLEPLASETFANDSSHGNVIFENGSPAEAGIVTANIVFDASTNTYSLVTSTGSISFGPDDIDQAQSNEFAVVYAKDDGLGTVDLLTLTRPGTSGPLTFKYVGSAFWERQIGGAEPSSLFDALVYGVPTASSDVPRTGIANYQLTMLGISANTYAVGPLTGTGLASIDFGAGKVTVLGQLDFFTGDKFYGSADLAATAGTFSGTFVLRNFQTYTGEMQGRLFGPAAAEFGAVFTVRDDLGDVAVGTLMGRKDSSAPNVAFQREPGDPPLANSQIFAGQEAVLDFKFDGTVGYQTEVGSLSQVSNRTGQLFISYDVATNSYLLTAPDAGGLFGGTGFPLTPPGENSSLLTSTGQFVATQTWKQQTQPSGINRFGYSIFGMPTSPSALVRTGEAAYSVSFVGTLADSDYRNPFSLGGSAALIADLANGSLDLKGIFGAYEQISISPYTPVSFLGPITGSGTISSNQNSFNGSLAFNGPGSYSGQFSGQFFGPNAEEIGATFTATDGKGYAAGSFTGAKDETILAGRLTLADLTAQPHAFDAFLRNGIYTYDEILNYDPAQGAYYITLEYPIVEDEERFSFSNEDIDLAKSTASRTWYEVDGSKSISGYVNKAGSGNPLIQLTYTSYGIFNVDVDSTNKEIILLFGNRTPNSILPRSGSASYSGIVEGSARGVLLGETQQVTGTGVLLADFGAATFSSTLNIAANSAPLGSYTFAGSIATNGIFGTSASYPGFSGRMAGSFFGPNADEVGATWDIIQSQLNMEGVFVGKKD